MRASRERTVGGFSQPQTKTCKSLLSQLLPNTVFAPGYVHVYMCVCVSVWCLYTSVCLSVCVYDCLGSQRLSEPEFDEGTAVVSKGGWGFVSLFHCLPQTGLMFAVLFGALLGSVCVSSWQSLESCFFLWDSLCQNVVVFFIVFC